MKVDDDEMTSGFCGTLTHMAPEILSKQRYGLAVDIWSLGITVFEMVCGYLPLQGETREELFQAISRGIIKIPFRLRLSFDCVDFINICLQQDWRESRANINELVVHPFLIQLTDD